MNIRTQSCALLLAGTSACVWYLPAANVTPITDGPIVATGAAVTLEINAGCRLSRDELVYPHVIDVVSFCVDAPVTGLELDELPDEVTAAGDPDIGDHDGLWVALLPIRIGVAGAYTLTGSFTVHDEQVPFELSVVGIAPHHIALAGCPELFASGATTEVAGAVGTAVPPPVVQDVDGAVLMLGDLDDTRWGAFATTGLADPTQPQPSAAVGAIETAEDLNVSPLVVRVVPLAALDGVHAEVTSTSDDTVFARIAPTAAGVPLCAAPFDHEVVSLDDDACALEPAGEQDARVDLLGPTRFQVTFFNDATTCRVSSRIARDGELRELGVVEIAHGDVAGLDNAARAIRRHAAKAPPPISRTAPQGS